MNSNRGVTISLMAHLNALIFFFQGKDQWDQILSKDSAGMATNAEDFTKQFMSQMFGKESPAPPPGSFFELKF